MAIRRRCFLSAAAGLAALPMGCERRAPSSAVAPSSAERAELLLHARVYSGGNEPVRGVAEALAIAGGRVLALGSRAELDGLRGPETRVLELGEAFVMPGLTDAHAHLLGLGQTREIVDLRGAATLDEVRARLRAGAPPGDGWVLGRGWDQNLWGGAMPTAAELDESFAERPVWLRRVDGHAGWANTAAMKLAGLSADTPDPEGGEFLRDEGGAPTGVLVDAAMDSIPVPEPSAEDLERWIRTATQEAASLGLTGVHEMGLGGEAHRIFTRLAQAGELPLRVHGYASEAWWHAGLDGEQPGQVDPTTRYALAGIKVYVDGALGSRGAAMLAPYSDRAGHLGALMHEPQYYVDISTQALERGFQVASHAIGDRGIRTIIEAYAAAMAATKTADQDRRLRIEHAQVIAPEDIPRLAEHGLIASMQPTHATSDMPWAPARVGPERLAGAYAWQRMLAAGVPLAFGSDFPVERPSPLLGLYAAITRQDLDGQPAGGWLPDQRVDLDQAIHGFTAGAAHAAHREGHLGRLGPGYAADLTVLAKDPFALDDPRELPELEVLGTAVGGELIGL